MTDDLSIPDFLRISVNDRAAAWQGFTFVTPTKMTVPARPKRVKVPKPPKVIKAHPKVDTTGKRWDQRRGRWIAECDLATVGAVLQNQPVPTVTRSCIELDAPIIVLKTNPRQFGTGAFYRFDAMQRYVATHKGATVGAVLANTSYRKDDYEWDLRRGNVK